MPKADGGAPQARIPPALLRRIEGVRLYAPGLHSVALQSPGYYFLATDTPAVMRWLAAELERAGVELRLMQSFTDARRIPGGWQVAGLGRLREKVGEALGLAPALAPTATRAGLIPCGGPVRPLAAPGVVLTGDAAGIVSPVTAGGIHSAWRHGEAVGAAIVDHLLHGGPDPATVAERAAPRFRSKRLLRWAFDHLQHDWPFDVLIGTPPLRWAAERVYFRIRPGGGPRSGSTP